jgi:hypothetical protein
MLHSQGEHLRITIRKGIMDAMKLAVLLLIAAHAFAVEKGSCDQPYTAPFRSDSELRLDIRAGDINISGSDEPVVRVTCVLKDPDEAKDVMITFEEAGKSGRLRVFGGPNNDVRIDIQVPKQSNLVIRFTAGDLELTGVRGHKDVSMRAGDLTINVGDPSDYRTAEASVTAGDLNAVPFGIHKGGLFRSFKRQNSGGKYRLRASLWAGDIRLR